MSCGTAKGWRLAAAAGAAAGLADVATAGWAHLDAAGHAQRRIGRGALLRLDELRRRVHLGWCRLRPGLVRWCVLDGYAAAQRLRIEVLFGRSGGSGAVVLRHGPGALLGREDAEFRPLLQGQVLDREP